ncbi:hypothetical protein FOE78_13665 [Microlunatus elymi]|uniref:Alpha-L-rhamnosidase n=1 Tax=Microlunatus elymi TaxID=2596828 RepID=A0A516Q094_9ACTN|nr:glycosyl hydrolase [Microlunatus elymi]QDP96817.1 hypothetical protein FOE78_13665 [Microlunatus elymi]
MTAGPTAAPASLADLRAGFLTPPPDSRPMMRWWWFGPAVQRAELDRELRVMAAAGLGGVEVSFVYPLVEHSPEMMSAEVLGHLRYAAEQARDLGLRFDLTLGSGWSFGGPHIDTERAAHKLDWERRELSTAGLDIPVASAWPGEQIVAGYVGLGLERPVDYQPLEISDGLLHIPAGSGPRQLLLAVSRPTGQLVKRAAAGADGPVLDHFSAAAARSHIEHVAEPLLRAVGAELVGSVFCDSLEVYAANWTPELITEFAARRGYPLLPRLHQLIIDEEGSARLRIDYFRTLTELYEENFVTVFRDWAAGHGVPFRIQGYGTPPAKISSYRFADLYEGEGWGWKKITQGRWATSAGHLYGLAVVSSETWTWVHSPSFRATALDLKGEAHEHLLSGINQFIGHGWPYSPSGSDRDPDGLGWYFYAAGALDDRNPWWPAMPELARYLQRLCWLMRQGRPIADVLIFVPCDDLYPGLGREVGGNLDLWHHAAAHIDRRIPATIRENGWDYDLVDDETLTAVDPADRPVLILPAVTNLRPETQAWLEKYELAGGVIFSIDGSPVQGARTVSAEDLAAALDEVVAPDLRLADADGEVGTVHRRVGDQDVYLVINTGPYRRRLSASPRVTRSAFELWDPDAATVRDSGSSFGGTVGLELEPYQATVLVLHDDSTAAPSSESVEGPITQPQGPQPVEGSELNHNWTVQFGAESPTPIDLPHRWEDDPARTAFSGTATYRTTVDLDRDWLAEGSRMILDFGPVSPTDAGSSAQDGIRGNSYRVAAATPVGEIVQVTVNDQHCGTLWAPPYRIEIGDQLRTGSNSITLQVSNTAANAVAVDTAIGRAVSAGQHNYGRRFAMQDLAKAADGLSSGLLTVPVLRRLR